MNHDDSPAVPAADEVPGSVLGAQMSAWAAVACAVAATLGAAGVYVTLLLRAQNGAADPANAGAAALGFAAGVGAAAMALSSSLLMVGWADLVDRRLVLPVGLLGYGVVIAAMGLVVFSAAESDWAGFTPLLWGIAAGTTVWVLTQAIWSYRWAVRLPRETSTDPDESRPNRQFSTRQ